jgi:hypothetical protein
VLKFKCPYLGTTVECSEERERHIVERHPELRSRFQELLATTLRDPDEVRQSNLFPFAHLFSRWYTDVGKGKYVVVVVVGEPGGRHWVVTAYIARKLSGGTPEWKRN